MINPEQIIALARVTLERASAFPAPGENITEWTDAELVKFAQEAIDAATLPLREELETSNAKGFELCTELATARDLLAQAAAVIRQSTTGGSGGGGNGTSESIGGRGIVHNGPIWGGGTSGGGGGGSSHFDTMRRISEFLKR